MNIANTSGNTFFDHFNSFEDEIAIRNKVLVHSEGIEPPEEILVQRYTEDAQIYEWRIRNYVPITKSSWDRALSVLQRIFISSKYRYEVHKDVKKYLKDARFKNLTFDLFLQQMVCKVMLEDPNAWLVWIPIGEGVSDSQKEVDLEPIIVSSDNKKLETKDEIVFYDEFDKVAYHTTNNEVVDDGDVFYKIDKYNIYRVYRIDDSPDGDQRYKEEVYYNHGFGFIPYITLGGRYSSTYKCYFSFFHSFVEIANEAIKQFSDWQVIMATCAYPIKEVANIPCQYHNKYGSCHDGMVPTSDGGEDTCPKCGGTGYIQWTPTTTLVRKESDDFSEFDPRPMLQYHTPDVNIIQYSEKAWKDLLDKAERSLNMIHTLKPQSGIAKEIDREDMKSFLSEISNNVFGNIFYNSLKIISHYRLSYLNKSGKVPNPKIYQPTTFNIKDLDELEIDYQEYKANQIDSHLITKTYLEVIDKRFNGNEFENKIAETITEYDKYFHCSFGEKMELFSSGNITKRELLISNTIHNFVRIHAKSMEEKDFIDMDFKIIKTVLDGMYDEYVKEIEESENAQNTKRNPQIQETEELDGEIIAARERNKLKLEIREQQLREREGVIDDVDEEIEAETA